ncbi:MAG TPA: radical SAM protein [bacterium]|nr:radical SAM protein [bacterium]
MQLLEFSQFKIFNHIDRVWAILRGELAPPVTLEIDPTNVCNHNCIWCIDSRHRETNKSVLPRELALQALSDARAMGVHSLVVKGGGEPLVYPHIVELLQHAKDIGLEVGIITNGERLLEHQDIIRRTCSWVRVSLDAGSAETHNNVHRPANPLAYERIWQGIEALSADVLCGVIYIIHPETFHEMPIAAKRARATGCRYIGFKRVVADSELFDTEMYMTIDANYVFAKHNYETENFSVMGFRIYNFSKGPKGRPYELCLGHHLVGILCANGTLYACCSTRGIEEYAIGNIHEQRLPDIWQGARRREVLAKITAGKCKHICPGHTSYMRYDHYNELFAYLARGQKPHGNFL